MNDLTFRAVHSARPKLHPSLPPRSRSYRHQRGGSPLGPGKKNLELRQPTDRTKPLLKRSPPYKTNYRLQRFPRRPRPQYPPRGSTKKSHVINGTKKRRAVETFKYQDGSSEITYMYSPKRLGGSKKWKKSLKGYGGPAPRVRRI